MKNGSKFLRLALVGVLGAVVMIGCADDNTSDAYYDENGCRNEYIEETDVLEEICDGPAAVSPGDDTVPEDETTTTVEETTTTVEETTTTVEEAPTTVPRPTTTVKKTTAATAPPTTRAAETTTVPPTTAAPTTAAPTTAPPTTQAPTTAPPTTLPPVNVSYMWSSDNGCGGLGFLILDVDVTGATSAGTISVSVSGSPVSSYAGPTNFGIGDTSMIMFDQWPTLPNGTYPVTITASSSTQGPTTRTTSVTYNCPV
jgi:hypothetical protein